MPKGPRLKRQKLRESEDIGQEVPDENLMVVEDVHGDSAAEAGVVRREGSDLLEESNNEENGPHQVDELVAEHCVPGPSRANRRVSGDLRIIDRGTHQLTDNRDGVYFRPEIRGRDLFGVGQRYATGHGSDQRREDNEIEEETTDDDQTDEDESVDDATDDDETDDSGTDVDRDEDQDDLNEDGINNDNAGERREGDPRAEENAGDREEIEEDESGESDEGPHVNRLNGHDQLPEEEEHREEEEEDREEIEEDESDQGPPVNGLNGHHQLREVRHEEDRELIEHEGRRVIENQRAGEYLADDLQMNGGEAAHRERGHLPGGDIIDARQGVDNLGAGRREGVGRGEGRIGADFHEANGDIPLEDNAIGDEDLLLTDEEADMEEGPQRPLFQGIRANAGMNLPLQYKEELTAIDHLLQTLAVAIRFNHTYENIICDLKRLKAMFENINIPTTKSQLWECLGKDKRNMVYRLYCTACKEKIGHGTTKPTRNCSCGKCGPDLPETLVGTFIQLKLGPQLKQLLNLPNMAEALNYKNNRVKQDPSAIEDIYDGAEYKRLEEEGRILSNPNNFSLMLWTDGVKLADSSHATTYPIILQVNELHPYARAKHLLFAGLWVGRRSPCTLSTIMLPIAQDINRVVVVWNPDGRLEVISRFVAPLFTADSIAKPNMCRMRQFNGKCGCPTCLAPGEQIQRGLRVYPAQPFPLRTDEGIRRDAAIAFHTGLVTNGVKGFSALGVLSDFDLVKSVPVDSMHNAFEGVAKQCYTHQRTNVGEPYYIGLAECRIDERLLSITPPSRISRQPRSIALYANWKASEWRNWVLYYSVPCLTGILPPVYLKHWSKFVEAMYILHKSSISEIELNRADTLITEFIRDFQRLYGLRNMSFNVHLLGHSVYCVRNWGPSWVFATYVFESFNRDIVASVTSPHHRGDQIVTRFLMRKFIIEMAREHDIAEETEDVIEEQLNATRITVPPGMSEGHYFSGKGPGSMRQPTPQEVLLIREAGFPITLETVITLYKKVIIHGVKNEITTDVERKFRDDVVYSRTGFWIASHFLRYENEENRICGFLGKSLIANRSLFGINYMRSVTRSPRNAFVSYRDVIAPGILMTTGNVTCAVPLANCFEID